MLVNASTQRCREAEPRFMLRLMLRDGLLLVLYTVITVADHVV